jgi:hypothetical protein
LKELVDVLVSRSVLYSNPDVVILWHESFFDFLLSCCSCRIIV